LRFNYEYHPNNGGPLSLEVIDSLDPKTAVNTLLSKTERGKPGDVGRDLRGLVGAWMYRNTRLESQKLGQGRSKTISISQNQNSTNGVDDTGWQDVNEWLVSTSLNDFPLAADVVEQWAGPQDADLGSYGNQEDSLSRDDQMNLVRHYGQACLAVVYATPDTGTEAVARSRCVLSRVATLLEIDGPSVLSIYDDCLPTLDLDLSFLSEQSGYSLLHNSLIQPLNPLTCPNNQSVSFLDAILVSIRTLNDLGHSISCRTAVDICLFSGDDIQSLELHFVLEKLRKVSKTGRNWRDTRRQLLWLRNWRGEPEFGEADKQCRAGHGLFWRVSLFFLEKEILKALLAGKRK
jgi:hypothetical protein